MVDIKDAYDEQAQDWMGRQIAEQNNHKAMICVAGFIVWTIIFGTIMILYEPGYSDADLQQAYKDGYTQAVREIKTMQHNTEMAACIKKELEK